MLVRDLSALVHGRTKHDSYSHVCPYCLYCFSQARLLTAYLPDCSIHPEQKVEYPSPHDPEKNIKKFKAIAKTLPVPFVLYADFEAFLKPAEENKESVSNTKYVNSTSLAGSHAFESHKYPSLTGKYSRTAEKTR